METAISSLTYLIVGVMLGMMFIIGTCYLTNLILDMLAGYKKLKEEQNKKVSK